MIAYYKLFDYLNRHGIKRSRLRDIISPATLSKLVKNETVRTDVIDKVCKYLDCQPGNIMEYIPEEKSMF